jgi:hypothetical protein
VQKQFGIGGTQVLEKPDQVLQRSPEPVHRSGHHQIELATG